MRTANPALTEAAFQKQQTLDVSADDVMTINGAINKSFILVLLVSVAAVFSWNRTLAGQAVQWWIWGGALGGFAVALITVFKPRYSPYTAPLYAVLEGLFLGAISSIFEAAYPGIVFQAIFLTFGILAGLLLAYRAGWIKASPAFRKGIVAATLGVGLVYLVSIVGGFFGFNIPYIHEGGTIGIIFSLVVVVIAALNLVLDFDLIERGAEARAPSYMEWYAAFGLMVTLVWLYIEILRLLSKLRR